MLLLQQCTHAQYKRFMTCTHIFNYAFITIKNSIVVIFSIICMYDSYKYMEKEWDGLLNFSLDSGPKQTQKWVMEQEIVEHGWSCGGLHIPGTIIWWGYKLKKLWCQCHWVFFGGLVSWYVTHGLTEYIYLQSVFDSLLHVVTHDFKTKD